MQRRQVLQGMATGLATVAAPWVVTPARAQSGPQVVFVGGGFGGATAARYIKRLAPRVQITLIEPNAEFIMCPMSNRVIYGGLGLKDISRPYARFVDRNGLKWVRAMADDIDLAKREVRAGGNRIAYDRLIIAPGVDYDYAGIEGLQTAQQQSRAPHAWKAGEQTLQLRQMLQAMPDNGVVAMHIPKVPYRCPPGPYERASLLAYYLQTRKPKGKLVVFDANPEIQAKKGLFEAVWKNKYPGLIEYIPNADLKGVDTATGTLEFDVQGKVRADVINVIPPQRAGNIARKADLANVAERWCGVDFLSYESTAVQGVHVLGDSIAGSPGMPKSAHMANQQAKVCAGAVAAQVLGVPVPDNPIIANTCYSFVSHNEVIHVAAVYRYDRDKKIMVPAPGAGGVSPSPTTTEGIYAMSWATNIMNDTLG